MSNTTLDQIVELLEDVAPRPSLRVALENLGVDSWSDLDFITETDLLQQNVKLVKARKFLASWSQRRQTSRNTISNTNHLDEIYEQISSQSHALSFYVDDLQRSIVALRYIKPPSEEELKQFEASTVHNSVPISVTKNEKLQTVCSQRIFPLSSSLSSSRGSRSKVKRQKVTKQTNSAEEVLPTIFVSESSQDSPEEVPKVVHNCSLMEYESLITASTPLEVINFIEHFSTELNKRIGGKACPASDIQRVSESSWRVNVKWAIPVHNFSNPDAPDPNDLAEWIQQQLPPYNKNKMQNSKGILIDVDFSVFDSLVKSSRKVAEAQNQQTS